MASWKRNPVVGIVAGVVFVVAVIFIALTITQRFKRSTPVLSEEEKQRQLEQQGVKTFSPPSPNQ